MARTNYPTFLRRTREYSLWLQSRRSRMEQEVGISGGSSQDAQLTAILNALAAISPANGWPLYTEGP